MVASTCLIFAGVADVAGQSNLDLPLIPEDHNFIQDYAGILDREALVEIGIVQEEAFGRHRTPIMVVTIPNRAAYGGREYSIEEFSRAWFDHWEIGAAGDDGELLNRGILLLVSRRDRVARIELGAEWGRGWDAYAQEIMDERIVPAFELRKYNRGVVDGSWALLDLAARGPSGSPPGHLTRSLRTLAGPAFAHSPFPVWLSLLVFMAGLGMIIVACRDLQNKKTLLFLGLTLVAGALVFWMLLALFAVLFRSRSAASSGSGFRSAGGFGGGGFSGGGGATGRW